MKDQGIIVFTPPASLEPSVAIAASRLGLTGIFDLQYASDLSTAGFALRKLERLAPSGYGVSLPGDLAASHWRFVENLPRGITTVVLPGNADEGLEERVGMLREKRCQVLIEAVTIDEVHRAAALSVDGVIVKGAESGGRVGPDTAFILFQRARKVSSVPLWVRGGIGAYTAAACLAGGAQGLCLDAQLYLLPDSGLPEHVKNQIRQMDGTETVLIGESLGETYRIYRGAGRTLLEKIRREEDDILKQDLPLCEKRRRWRTFITSLAGWSSPEERLFLLGQDACLARTFAERYGTLASVCGGIFETVERSFSLVRTTRPLDRGSPLARAHGTVYPIVQGPMNRVSDVPAFAKAVADEGALPFVALGLLPGRVIESLLEHTRETLAGKPWGVGLLGFTSAPLQDEQFDIVCTHRPPFALIAGGRADQAARLEAHGIATYLHVPSPVLLRHFLEKGARKFIFEGSECGGHIGPRTSFVLWDTSLEVLESFLSRYPDEADRCQVLFAGGISDAVSSAMVATMAAPAAAQGVKVGVQLGTAYLFTAEAVSCGAILREFQEEALRCRHTVVLETGPGHALRCSPTPFVETFHRTKTMLHQQRKPKREIQEVLEDLILGRLGIATRGVFVSRPRSGADGPAEPVFRDVPPEEQKREGLYMLGQVACLKDEVLSIKDLHEDISVAGTQHAVSLAGDAFQPAVRTLCHRSSDIAIVGMACLLPGAPVLERYWENIVHKVSAIREVPPERWDWRLWYDPDPKAPDKCISRWGGFLDEVPFDPLEFGMPPSSIPSIEPLHLLTLLTVKKALEDAGYDKRPFPRDRTSVILGAGGGIADLGLAYAFRSFLPFVDSFLGTKGISSRSILRNLDGFLPEWTEDSFAGILTNVAAGRVANRLDLGGVNYTVDAACASSLAAVSLAVSELERGSSDMVIVGGADTMQSPFAFLAFSKTMALSPRGVCRSLDRNADGIVISEGIGIVVLKRLEDAERDGDKIYAVIKGIAGSSDGKAVGLTAPRAEGQLSALQRAYEKAGISPARVELIEAHATGTPAGDKQELKALISLFRQAGAKPKQCAISSVKSMIGHTKCAAGIAGVIKVALCLHHKVLPPTINVENPLPEIAGAESPFYVCTEPRPWIHAPSGGPRKAGVSAMGFGGTNFHAVLEEYVCPQRHDVSPLPVRELPCELFVWEAPSRADLAEALAALERSLSRWKTFSLKDLSFTLMRAATGGPGAQPWGARLAIVADSPDDVRAKLAAARVWLSAVRPDERCHPSATGIFYADPPLLADGKLVFLFPGQGAQYRDMIQDLTLLFSEVRESIEKAEWTLSGKLPERLSSYIYPPPGRETGGTTENGLSLLDTEIAQPAIAAVSMGIFRLLKALGIHPDLMAGHSLGEFTALCAAGCFSEEDLYLVAHARGEMIKQAQGSEAGAMAAVRAGRHLVEEIVKDHSGCWVTNLNSPAQTVISGRRAAVGAVVEEMGRRSVSSVLLPVKYAFHSPLVAAAGGVLEAFLKTLDIGAPTLPVFSNTTATTYPSDPAEIPAMLREHLARPVRWVEEVEAIYDAGGRVFVEVGPSGILTDLVRRILKGRRFLALQTDRNGKGSLSELLSLVGHLYVHGYPVSLERLYQGRDPSALDVTSLAAPGEPCRVPATAWMVDGTRARPASVPRRAVEAPKGSSASASEGDGGSSAAEARHAFSLSAVPGCSMPSGSAESFDEILDAAPERAAGSGQPFEVMRHFQGLMDRFLETQRSVMLAYLSRTPHGDDRQRESCEPPLDETCHGRTGTEDAFERASSPPGDMALSGDSTGARALPFQSHDAEPPEPPGHDADPQTEVLEKLLTIVSELTGYPREVIGTDIDLEAELGIDSIKRIEILGEIRNWMRRTGRGDPEAKIEALSRQKSIRGILSQLCTQPEAPAHSTSASASQGAQVESRRLDRSAGWEAEVPQARVSVPAREAISRDPAPRFLLQPSPLPLTEQRPFVPPEGAMLLTEDGAGISDLLCERLSSAGQRIVRLWPHQEGRRLGKDRYCVDSSSYGDVARVIREVRNEWGRIGGIVHLVPLCPQERLEGIGTAKWRELLQREIKLLFHLLKAAGEDLAALSGSGSRMPPPVIAVTAMGGHFACADGVASSTYFPGQGGLQGLLKTVAREFPGIDCRVIDLPASLSAPRVADRIVIELGAGKGPVEVGFDGTRRLTLRPYPAPLDVSGPCGLKIGPDSTILVTGGARGITFGVTYELAVRYRPRLVLVGSTPTPAPREAPQTRGLTSKGEIKEALIAQCRAEGIEPRLQEIEKRYRRLCKEREIRNNLLALERTGARVEYVPLDVRDTDSFGGFLDRCYDRFGRIDGVIHGAGIIEDKGILEKTPESFDRVFDTKVDSAFTLAKKLRPESLRFLVFFSSVAGTFGNKGQCDYAAANEVLNKLALYLDARWPARVVSINWGPWDTGMVGPELKKEFAKRGLLLIPEDTGRDRFLQELLYGRKGEAEVILGDIGGWEYA